MDKYKDPRGRHDGVQPARDGQRAPEQRMEAAFQAIMALPQAGAIKPEDARAWLAAAEGVIDRSHDLGWHIRRAGAIGSSEAGVAWLEHHNKRPPFANSRYKIAAIKLFREPPDPLGSHLERGLTLEPCIRALFRSGHWNGVRSARVTAVTALDADLAALREFSFAPQGDYGPVGGEPDDYVEIGGKRYLVDYKSPAAAPAPGEHQETDILYAAQLCWLRIKATRGPGLPVDGLLLVKLDHAAWRLRVAAVDDEPSFAAELLNLNRALWNDHVLTGALPPRFEPPPFQIDSALAESIGPRCEQLLYSILMCRAWREESERLKRLLAEKIGLDRAQAGKVARVGGLAMGVDEQIDEDAVRTWFARRGLSLPRRSDIDEGRLRATLRALNVTLNLDDFRRPTDDIDWPRALKEIGKHERSRAFMEPRPWFAPSKMDEARETVNGAAKRARSAVSNESRQAGPSQQKTARRAARRRRTPHENALDA